MNWWINWAHTGSLHHLLHPVPPHTPIHSQCRWVDLILRYDSSQFNKYSLNSCYVPGAIKGTGVTKLKRLLNWQGTSFQVWGFSLSIPCPLHSSQGELLSPPSPWLSACWLIPVSQHPALVSRALLDPNAFLSSTCVSPWCLSPIKMEPFHKLSSQKTKGEKDPGTELSAPPPLLFPVLGDIGRGDIFSY